MIGSLRGTLLDRADRRGAGRGRRRRLPGHASRRPPWSQLGDVGAEVFLHVHHHVREDAETLYGFPTRDERDVLRGAARRPRRRARAGPGHPVGARPRRAAPGAGRRRRRRPVPRARRRQEDGGPPADRAEVPPRRAGARRRPPVGAGRRRRRPPGRCRSARADVREALAGLGYGPDEVAWPCCATCPTATTPPSLLRQALQRLARG